MEKTASPPRIWVLTDDRPGNRTQSIGVAQQLPFAFEEKHLQFSKLGGWPNRLLGASPLRLTKASRALLAPPYPDIAIAAGRRLAPALRYIKRKNPNCFTVYLMHPQCGFSHFDLVAMPQHDNPPARDNVLATVGSIHALTAEKLEEEKQKWQAKLSHLPQPRIAVLVGGNSKSAQFTSQDFHEIGLIASNLAGKDGSLMVTTSPRTGPRAEDFLRLSLAAPHELFLWRRGAENPYHAFLALADVIIVTGDSMSMCAEACAPGKPVFIYQPRYGSLAPKLLRFHEALFERGLAQPLTHGVSANWQPAAPLNEAGRVAAEILRRFSNSSH